MSVSSCCRRGLTRRESSCVESFGGRLWIARKARLCLPWGPDCALPAGPAAAAAMAARLSAGGRLPRLRGDGKGDALSDGKHDCFPKDPPGLPVDWEGTSGARGFLDPRRKGTHRPQGPPSVESVREMTKRKGRLSMRRGSYCSKDTGVGESATSPIQECRANLLPLDKLIRNRLRLMPLKGRKWPKKLQGMLVLLTGEGPQEAEKVRFGSGERRSIRPAVRFTLNDRRFRRQGQLFLEDDATRFLETGFRR